MKMKDNKSRRVGAVRMGTVKSELIKRGWKFDEIGINTLVVLSPSGVESIINRSAQRFFVNGQRNDRVIDFIKNT